MNEFESLRLQAKDKRDAAIANARQDYRRTISQIAALRKSITGPTEHRDVAGYTNRTTLRETIVTVLADRKLTKIEIVVGVLELGYKTDMRRVDLIKHVNRILRTDGRIKWDGSKWAAN